MDMIRVSEGLLGSGGTAFAPAGQQEWKCWLAAGHTIHDDDYDAVTE